MTLKPWAAPEQPSTDVARRDTDSWTDVVADVARLADMIHATEFVPASLRSAPKVAAAILYGRELGMPPMTSLGSVNVIQGRASLYSETMRALIQAAGHELRVTEMTADRCVIKGRRRDEDEWVSCSYTMGEAQRSGDAQKNPNYKTRPAEMLLARASSRLAKMHFADVIKGLASVEEVIDENGVVASLPPAAAPTEVVEEAPAAPRAIGRQRRAPKPAQETPVEAAEAPAAPVAARRPPLPSRAPVAASEPAAEVDTLPVEGQPDAEVVEEQPAGDTRQLRAIAVAQQHWQRLGVDARAERLWYAGVVVGREVTSHKELTPEELRHLIGVLEKARSIDAINALVDKSGAES